MPIKLKDALSDRQFTSAEATDVLQGAQAQEVDGMVQELEIAVNAPSGNQLDLSTTAQQNTLNDFLTKLDQVKPLPLDHQKAKKPDGTMDWISVLRVQSGNTLPSNSFGGKTLAVDAQGGLVLGGQNVGMSTPPNDAQVEALLGLSRPNQLTNLPSAQRKALVEQLFNRIAQTIPSKIEPGKYRNIVAGTAALAALTPLAKELSSQQIDTLLALFAGTQTPLGQALILRALDGASLTTTQQAARQALSVAVATVLVPRFDAAATSDGLSAMAQMIGATYARDASACASFDRTSAIYSALDAPDTALNDEEASALLRDMEAYVDGSQQTSFVYGALLQQAPKNFAKLTNARVVAQLTPALQGAQPSLLGSPLSPDEAKFVQSILPGLANTQAAQQLADLFTQARSLFGTPATQPLPVAAFVLLQGQVSQFFDRRADSSDGMLDLASLSDALQTAVADINQELAPRLATLSATPPSFDGVALSANAASSIRRTLESSLRSPLSISNLTAALKIIAAAHGGRVDDAGATQFDQLITFYRNNWPSAQTFDFNKLGRMATFIVQGKAVPLCTIGGKQIPLGEFYAQVGRTVTASIDPSSQEYDWMPERFGLRAKQAVELLDVIAQQTAEGAGPIVALQKAYPGKAISVRVLGKNGGHEQFIFDVAGVGRFNQGSDGTMKAYTTKIDRELFTARIASDGTFDVSVPSGQRKLTGWPLQTPYEVGDLVDIRFLDPSAANSAVEGKLFSDQHKVLQARIDSYDAAGHYTISYKKPDGSPVSASTTLREIEASNNPHNFELDGSSFSDVEIDINRQPRLKKFIDDAKAIVAKYLPRDGSAFARSTDEQAKAQRACVEALQAYMRPLMTYPTEMNEHPDAASQAYHTIIDGLTGWGDTVPLEKLLEIARGVCRHQCIIEQLVMQVAGIDSRLASGAANTSGGDFRGYHIWNELSLADNARYLSDQTWDDAIIPLWNGAYDSDKRRIELYHRTAQYDPQIV